MNIFGWILTNIVGIAFGIFLGWNFHVLFGG